MAEQKYPVLKGSDVTTTLSLNLVAALKEKKPVLVPVYPSCGRNSGKLPKYVYTLGVSKLVEGGYEMVISGSEAEQGASILQKVTNLLLEGKLSQREWKEGTILENKVTGVSTPLRIHFLGKEVIESSLGWSISPKLGFGPKDKAFQLVWPNKKGNFAKETVEFQLQRVLS